METMVQSLCGEHIRVPTQLPCLPFYLPFILPASPPSLPLFFLILPFFQVNTFYGALEG